jgi:hypothetical protein
MGTGWQNVERNAGVPAPKIALERDQNLSSKRRIAVFWNRTECRNGCSADPALPRGLGQPGIFSIHHVLEDADAAVTFVLRPEIAEKFGIDTRRIVLGGHSMGGRGAPHGLELPDVGHRIALAAEVVVWLQKLPKLAQLLRKRWLRCAAMDHPVADKQSRRRIEKSWYPFHNQIVESIDRGRFSLGVS